MKEFSQVIVDIIPRALHSTELSQHNDLAKLTANFKFPRGHCECICSFVQEVRAKVNNETSKEKPIQLNAQKSLDTSGQKSKRK